MTDLIVIAITMWGFTAVIGCLLASYLASTVELCEASSDDKR